jgi:hypothetical protein
MSNTTYLVLYHRHKVSGMVFVVKGKLPAVAKSL